MYGHHFLIMYSLIYFKYFCIVDIVMTQFAMKLNVVT